jgi:hypothetical protein
MAGDSLHCIGPAFGYGKGLLERAVALANEFVPLDVYTQMKLALLSTGIRSHSWSSTGLATSRGFFVQHSLLSTARKPAYPGGFLTSSTVAQSTRAVFAQPLPIAAYAARSTPTLARKCFLC